MLSHLSVLNTACKQRGSRGQPHGYRRQTLEDAFIHVPVRAASGSSAMPGSVEVFHRWIPTYSERGSPRLANGHVAGITSTGKVMAGPTASPPELCASEQKFVLHGHELRVPNDA